MIELNYKLHSTDIVKTWDYSNETYKETLFTQEDNTANGISNKFILLKKDDIEDLLNNISIKDFLLVNKYI